MTTTSDAGLLRRLPTCRPKSAESRRREAWITAGEEGRRRGRSEPGAGRMRIAETQPERVDDRVHCQRYRRPVDRRWTASSTSGHLSGALKGSTGLKSWNVAWAACTSRNDASNALIPGLLVAFQPWTTRPNAAGRKLVSGVPARVWVRHASVNDNCLKADDAAQLSW